MQDTKWSEILLREKGGCESRRSEEMGEKANEFRSWAALCQTAKAESREQIYADCVKMSLESEKPETRRGVMDGYIRDRLFT